MQAGSQRPPGARPSVMADGMRRSPRSDRATGSDAPGRPLQSQASSPDRLKRAVWEREMRRLRVSARVLIAVLLALAVRVVVSGINAVIGFTAAIVAGLLIVSLGLARQGRRLEPTSREELRD